MPEISRFFGIVIRMFAESGGVHHLSHLHARAGSDTAVYSIVDGARLGGSLPLAKERLVLAWIELHREELEENWSRLQTGRPPLRIDPLR